MLFFSSLILNSIRSVRLHIRKKFQIAVFSAEDVIVFQNVIFVYEIMIRRALVLQLIIIPVIPPVALRTKCRDFLTQGKQILLVAGHWKIETVCQNAVEIIQARSLDCLFRDVIVGPDHERYLDIASGVRCGFSWMNFNGVLGNKTLRQAILMAIDNDTICNSKTIGGLYTPGFSVLPSTLNYGYDELVNPYTYDPEKAKQILDEAGIVDTDGDGIRELDGQNINLRYISYENRLLNDFSDANAQYLAEIGIGVVPEYDLNNNNWMTVGTGDPLAFMANWATDTTYCAYSNPEYDELYKELQSEMDPEKRKDIIFQMQQILIDDAAVLIDGYYNSSMIYNNAKVGSAHIHTADYYWLSTEIVPAE